MLVIFTQRTIQLDPHTYTSPLAPSELIPLVITQLVFRVSIVIRLLGGEETVSLGFELSLDLGERGDLPSCWSDMLLVIQLLRVSLIAVGV